MKVVMVDGHSSMDILLKVVIWYQKNVLHTLLKQKENIAVNTSPASLSLIFKKVTLLEEDMVSQVKKK